jgi:hypothetical protein
MLPRLLLEGPALMPVALLPCIVLPASVLVLGLQKLLLCWILPC